MRARCGSCTGSPWRSALETNAGWNRSAATNARFPTQTTHSSARYDAAASASRALNAAYSPLIEAAGLSLLRGVCNGGGATSALLTAVVKLLTTAAASTAESTVASTPSTPRSMAASTPEAGVAILGVAETIGEAEALIWLAGTGALAGRSLCSLLASGCTLCTCSEDARGVAARSRRSSPCMSSGVRLRKAHVMNEECMQRDASKQSCRV
eukprot:1815532-Pleurochrysis_carterae.AAC.2